MNGRGRIDFPRNRSACERAGDHLPIRQKLQASLSSRSFVLCGEGFGGSNSVGLSQTLPEDARNGSSGVEETFQISTPAVADVVVIGYGYADLFCAVTCAKAGHLVTAIDAAGASAPVGPQGGLLASRRSRP